MLHICFPWVFSVINHSSPSSSSLHAFAPRHFLFFFLFLIQENTEDNAEENGADDSFRHSGFPLLLPFSLTFHTPPPSPHSIFFPHFFSSSGFHWLSGLAHLLRVGGAYPLLVGDPLADKVLRGLRGRLGTRDGHLPVPGSGDELALLGDLDPGARQLLVLH